MEFTNIDIKKGADNVKGFVKGASKTALNTSDKLVEGSLEAAEKWQEVAEKALQTGTVIFGKQQDLALTVLEGVKQQGMMGAMRLKSLFSLNVSEQSKVSSLRKKEAKEVAKMTKQTIAEVEAKMEKAEQKAKNTIAKVLNKSAKKVDETVAKVEKVAAKKAATAKATVKKEIANVEKKAAAVAKAVTKKPVAKKTVKKTAPAVSAKKVVTIKGTDGKEDLKTINGVGPKMESVLNSLGIITFADLAKADAKKLEADLIAVNARYAMFETSEWVKIASAK
ncbi:MAG: putative flap endonuclease-1-like 5' DNA nuclease [Paraglaciecola sp.]|jgi:predicted flap endonuclease-1-like 5' DNA nuclease